MQSYKVLYAFLGAIALQGTSVADTETEVVEWEHEEWLFQGHDLVMTMQLGLDKDRIPWTLVFVLENPSDKPVRLAVPGTAYALAQTLFVMTDSSPEAFQRARLNWRR